MTETAETPTDINTLFSSDPLGHTNDDITEVIKHMRARRASYISAPASKPRASKKLTDAQQRAKALTLNLDMKL